MTNNRFGSAITRIFMQAPSSELQNLFEIAISSGAGSPNRVYLTLVANLEALILRVDLELEGAEADNNAPVVHDLIYTRNLLVEAAKILKPYR